MSRDSDKELAVFSAEGLLYQVEYAFKAVKSSGVTTVAIRTGTAAFVIAQKRIMDTLIKPGSITNLFDVDGNIGVATTGRVPDGRAVVADAREIASSYKYDYGVDMPIGTFAKRVADQGQVFTQASGRRIMGTALICVGLDRDDVTGEHAPRLYKVDPAGHFAGYFATASGQKETEAIAQLEKRLKEKPFSQLTAEEGAKAGLAVLQQVAGVTLKARDVEVGCVRTDAVDDGRRFHRIDAATVEQWLNSLAQDDQPTAE